MRERERQRFLATLYIEGMVVLAIFTVILTATMR